MLSKKNLQCNPVVFRKKIKYDKIKSFCIGNQTRHLQMSKKVWMAYIRQYTVVKLVTLQCKINRHLQTGIYVVLTNDITHNKKIITITGVSTM
jgi:hypothetical protein